ncbi:MAG: MerC domain-containing protein [Myxococcota bacterium]
MAAASASSSPSGQQVDRIGVFASAACAVHCAVVALIPAPLGAVGLGALLGHEAEWAFTIGAVAIAGLALLANLRRGGSGRITLLLGTGMAGLLASRFLEEAGVEGLGTGVAVGSGAVLVAAHILNIRAIGRRQRATELNDPCCEPK